MQVTIEKIVTNIMIEPERIDVTFDTRGSRLDMFKLLFGGIVTTIQGRPLTLRFWHPTFQPQELPTEI